MTNETELQHLMVFDAADLRVSHGVARGDPMSFADELVPDDIYRVGRYALGRMPAFGWSMARRTAGAAGRCTSTAV